MTNEPETNIALVPDKSDATKAETYRKELSAALVPVCSIIERGRKDGFSIGWAALGPDEFGRVRVPMINILKPL